MDFYEKNRHGSAMFATRKQIKQAGLYSKDGVYLGVCPYTNKPLHLKSDMPLTLVGGAGSGKGATILLYSNFYTGSLLNLDPKGEILAICGKNQKAMGKDVWSINPCALHTQAPYNIKQHKVNPFSILVADSQHLVSDCKRVALMLIEIESGKSFFSKRARQWLSNLLLAYALTSKNPNLSGFMVILNMIENNHEDFKALALGLYATLGNDDINLTCHEIINKRADKGASGEYSAVMSTLYTDMDFMSDPQLKTLFSASDFCLDVLSQTNPCAVVNISIPAENMTIWNKAVRLIIGVAILYQYRNPSSRPLFLIDEAATLGTFKELIDSYTYGRSFYRTFSVWQSLSQISKLYDREGIQTFLSSSQAQIFIGVRDLETAQYCSNVLGNQTLEIENEIYTARAKHAKRAAINNLMFNGGDPAQIGLELGHWEKEQSHRDRMQRPLMTTSEVLNMSEDQSLIFTSGLNLPPLLARRKPYFKDRKIRKYFQPNPYHA